MAKITVTVCDTCETQDEVRSYTLTEGERVVEVDLCATHAAALEALLPKPRPAAPKGVRRKVMSIEEIEALKVAGRV